MQAPRMQGVQSTFVSEGQEPLEVPGSELKLAFEVKLTFIAAIVLFYPVVLCILLHSKWPVQFFFGHWAIYSAVIVPLWVLMCHFAMINRVLSFRVAPIFMIVIPAAFLACTCQIQSWQFNGQESMLLAHDCQTFLVKARLDRAWWEAHNIFENCTTKLAAITGSPLRETQLVTKLSTCRGYDEGFEHYGYDWQFLEHVERTHHCGGWCTVQMPIWRQAREPSDSCSLAVGRTVVGSVSLLGFQVTVYCGILLFCSCVALLLNPGWFLNL